MTKPVPRPRFSPLYVPGEGVLSPADIDGLSPRAKASPACRRSTTKALS
ncbi:MAG: hypothetical protein OXB87_02635 [Hyphomicrobiales bacterium]|nr:hypothetical protein [Hyphomicrobiales bacterium]